MKIRQTDRQQNSDRQTTKFIQKDNENQKQADRKTDNKNLTDRQTTKIRQTDNENQSDR